MKDFIKNKIVEMIANEDTFTMYSGITLKKWDEIWKNKNLINKLTNVTSDIDFASDYSYNFETGTYEDLVIEISNIPIDAFVGYRRNSYKNDDDFHNISNFDKNKKINIINKYSLFLVDLYNYMDTIKVKLIKT